MKNIMIALGIVAGALGIVAGGVAVIIGLSALFALPVKWLWNYVIPHQFGLKEIDFLHAWGLNVLCGLIFKSSNYSNNSKKD